VITEAVRRESGSAVTGRLEAVTRAFNGGPSRAVGFLVHIVVNICPHKVSLFDPLAERSFVRLTKYVLVGDVSFDSIEMRGIQCVRIGEAERKVISFVGMGAPLGKITSEYAVIQGQSGNPITADDPY
jgi:hypothetical protein